MQEKEEKRDAHGNKEDDKAQPVQDSCCKLPFQYTFVLLSLIFDSFGENLQAFSDLSLDHVVYVTPLWNERCLSSLM